ncbi:glutaminase [Serinibacter arcticus]|uniref:Glutaminase n=1 Tax=Serinibacter arcticus TaxID=1655435 RepID=A0A2U1ZXI7_9MICO|nr:glutaminase [Serinibacter arcticus]PWD51660.1 glutaminase [Serinibacter arcticus]
MEQLVRDAVGRLRAGGVAPEVLGERRIPRRVLGVGRGARIEAVGEAWRLGGLLLLANGTLAVPGESVRTEAESTRGYTAESARRRAGLREEARRGGIPPGVVVHLGWRVVVVGEEPLTMLDGEVGLVWTAGAPAVPLGRYLTERVTLVLERP